MKKYGFIFLAIILLILGYNKYSNFILHERIDVNNVESIIIHGYGSSWNASDEEIKDIVNWYNSVTDIRNNKEGRGVGTPDSAIEIRLKPIGKLNRIRISKSGVDFEIQRYDKQGNHINYWGKQPDIKKLLLDAAEK